MSRCFLLASMLVIASAPTWANDLKPGQWEMTMSMEGEHLPSQLSQERTRRMCMSESETADMAVTMRERWQGAGCDDINVTRDDNIIEAQASCDHGGKATSIDGQATLHSDEHFTSQIVVTNDTVVTTHHEARWVSSDCEA
ncbi:DUF3617 domain-containing protein [Bisbaumannia pacifica]|uniref:DUF3617 family protein n=1 Tax=Bisbaumannia pacifica TaxID=77098 RepID=A0ABD4KWB1_9GAMM|nr:DUF3617 family protein [Halomonas pacifica]MBH8578740.1 DUF3617 family protein [Halomonas pacifica]